MRIHRTCFPDKSWMLLNHQEISQINKNGQSFQPLKWAEHLRNTLLFVSSPSLFTITTVLLICSKLLSTQRCSVLHCLLLQSVGASTSLQMQLSNIQNVHLQPECVIWTYPLKTGGYFEFTLTSFVCNKVILLSAG